VSEVEQRQETREDFAQYVHAENEAERTRLTARRLSHMRHKQLDEKEGMLDAATPTSLLCACSCLGMCYVCIQS
jgi:hypothetical protein